MSKSFFDKETDISESDLQTVNEALDVVSTVTKLLFTLSIYLENSCNDDVGAELVSDFAIEYSKHEEEFRTGSKKIDKNLLN